MSLPGFVVTVAQGCSFNDRPIDSVRPEPQRKRRAAAGWLRIQLIKVFRPWHLLCLFEEFRFRNFRRPGKSNCHNDARSRPAHLLLFIENFHRANICQRKHVTDKGCPRFLKLIFCLLFFVQSGNLGPLLVQ